MKIIQNSIIIGVASLLIFAVGMNLYKTKDSQKVLLNVEKNSTTTPQFVLLSFDGSKSLDMWRETREFAKQMNGKGKPLHFTYFINSIYFLPEKNKDAYVSPDGYKGDSRIGFAKDEEDVGLRIAEVKKAVDEGDEIASHTAGHFNGAIWDKEKWTKEFSSFENLIVDAQKNNPNEQVDTLFLQDKIVGFRAPDLGVNDALYKTLKDFHFAYDASGVGLPDAQPTKDSYGIWHIPLNTIFLDGGKVPAISMDYSLWMHQSKGKDVAKKGTALWDEYFNEVKSAYLDDFNKKYNHNRAPVVIGHHFSLWNDGVYWEAMKSFAEDVCGKPDVKCVTFSEYVKYLNEKSAKPLVKKQ